MNNKKTRLITIILIILNIAFAFSIIFINQKMMNDAQKFADEHDATYIIFPSDVFRIERDEVGNVFVKANQRFDFIGENGPIFYEKGEAEAFHLKIKNIIESWMIVASVGFVLSLFGIYYNSINRLTCYGYVLSALVCLVTVLGIGVLDGLHIYVAISYIIIAILIYREKERKIRKVKPVIPLDQLK